MRQRHNMLLAGVAALALIAGGGIAAAQQSPQGQTKAGASTQGAARPKHQPASKAAPRPGWSSTPRPVAQR